MKTQNYYANTDNNLRNKILKINTTLSVTIILAVIFSITDRKAFITNQDWPIITNIILAILIFEVGRLGYSLNSTLPIISENEEEIDSKRTKLTFDQQRELIHKIELLFENDKIFLNKNLNIWELSKLVGTNRTYISSIINAEYNKNFSSFVNYYRIKHVQMLILKNPAIGNITLANSSGFGSVASMQRAFYSIEGITLKEFRERFSSFTDKSDTEKL